MRKILTIEQLKSLEAGDWIWLIQRQEPESPCAYVEMKLARSDKYLTVGVDGCILDIPIEEYGTKWVAYRNKEEAEETSTMLPCKVGDTVYRVLVCQARMMSGRVYADTGKVKEIRIDEDGLSIFIEFSPIQNLWYPEGDFGKYIFFSQEAAEAQIKELKGREK